MTRLPSCRLPSLGGGGQPVLPILPMTPTITRWRWLRAAVPDGIERDRVLTRDQAKRSSFVGLESAAGFERDAVAVFGEVGEAATPSSPPVGEWLPGVPGAAWLRWMQAGDVDLGQARAQRPG